MKYNYSEAVEKQLKIFEEKLRKKGYAKDTIRQYRNYAGIYLAWLNVKHLKLEEIDYELFSSFVFQLKKEYSLNQYRKIILSIRHYYKTRPELKNVAAGLQIRRRRQDLLNEVISHEELKKIYSSYESFDDRGRRNKVILGLFVYQALMASDMERLEVVHIELKPGKIYVPGASNRNARKLDLAAEQLLEMEAYLRVIRPRLLANVEQSRSGRKPMKIDPIIEQRLFFSESGSSGMKNSIYHLFRKLRKEDERVKSAQLIRSVVIANWLKTRDIRMVQYMCGHKWVSSTERYNAYNLEELRAELDKYHPLK